MNFFINFYSSFFYVWTEFFEIDLIVNGRGIALSFLVLLQFFLFWLSYELVQKILHFDLAFGVRYHKNMMFLIGGILGITNAIIYNKKREVVILSNFYKK
jgi:hypothetical protein